MSQGQKYKKQKKKLIFSLHVRFLTWGRGRGVRWIGIQSSSHLQKLKNWKLQQKTKSLYKERLQFQTFSNSGRPCKSDYISLYFHLAVKFELYEKWLKELGVLNIWPPTGTLRITFNYSPFEINIIIDCITSDLVYFVCVAKLSNSVVLECEYPIAA